MLDRRVAWVIVPLLTLWMIGCPGDRDSGDADADGFSVADGDCDDQDHTVYPGADEVCDGKDNDCNDVRDDPFDLDLDGISTCGDDGSAGNQDDDCDDLNPEIYPNAEELCDGIDNDCSGRADDFPGIDEDQDGTCVEEGDCDDEDPTTHPDATEYCNGIDNDCNGVVDDGYDDDGDGHSPCDDDCDDDDPAVHGGADEECNGLDDDCDGLIDEDWDLDGDGWAPCSGDCDDENPDAYPGAAEQCNGVDDDCDGTVDEEVDEDGDGFTPCDGDCDDLEPGVHPGALDGPDGLDNDCDGDYDSFYGWDLNAAEIPVTVEGDANDHYGQSVAGGGDITGGDGIGDLLIGAHYTNGEAADSGEADVVAGEAADWFANPPILDVAHDIDGTTVDHLVGYSVSIGDVDDDGSADAIIGAPGPYPGVPDGDVYVFFGGPGAIGSSPSTDDADVSIHGDFPGERVGYSVSAAGDVDGDGAADLLAGAPYNNAEAGVPGIVYLFFGQGSWSGVDGTDDADVAMQGAPGDSLTGNAVAIVPDLDGDGYDEVLVGGEAGDDGDGRAYLLYGAASGWDDGNLEDADAVFVADGGEAWGARVGGCADIDGDGLGELWVGSLIHGAGGGVAVTFGSGSRLSGEVVLPDDADTVFEGDGGEEAAILACPGDLNGDGVQDVAVGAQGSDVAGGDAGALYIVTDAASSWPSAYDLATAEVRLLGETVGDWFGHAVAPAGDLNDDGYDDLVVTAPYNDQMGSASGKVYVVFGY